MRAMDLSGKRGEDHLGYHDSNIHGDWRFGNNPQAGFFSPTHASYVPICPGDRMMGSSPSPASVAGGFFDRSLYSQNPIFSDSDVQGNPILPPKAGAFFPNRAGILPPGLSQFPTDSGFIERAARFSCFNGVNVGDMASPLSARGSPIPLSNPQRNELGLGEVLKDVSMPVDNGSSVGSPMRNPRGNESCEHEFSVGGQEEAPNSDNTAGEPSSIGLGARKRKRETQEMELVQDEGDNQICVGTSKQNTDVKRKVQQENSTSPAAKLSGKHGKDSVDALKEDYVHVRARRGQATNSHSLAERVRRERISERMKFLQDLVPGCSKVTGKAVMLDEIINYVQSLQRQVEFLSMKLAAVNPQLDINIKGLLSKEILQSRTVSSTTIGFSPDIAHPELHPAPQAFVQSGIPGMGNPSDSLRRALNAHLTAMDAYTDHANQVQILNAWDTKLQNVVQMGFGSSATLNIQEFHGLPPPGHMKIEP